MNRKLVALVSIIGFVQVSYADENVGDIELIKDAQNMSEEETEKLKVGDVGEYGELTSRDNPDGLVLIYVPPITALLERAVEINKGPLSESQIKGLRTRGPAMAVPPDVAQSMLEERGGIE